jgi:hypothetical protein
MIFKVRIDYSNDYHTSVTVFAGETKNSTLANCGNLTMRTEEFIRFAQVVSNGEMTHDIIKDQLKTGSLTEVVSDIDKFNLL